MMNQTIRDAIAPRDRIELDALKLEDLPAQIRVLRQLAISHAQEAAQQHERYLAVDKLRAATCNTIAYLKMRLEEEL